MSRLFYIGVFLMIIHTSAISQTRADSLIWLRKIDTLKHKIENARLPDGHAKEDTNLIKNLCLLSEYYRIFWPDSALRIAYRVVELEKKLDYPSGRVTGYQSLSG